MGRSRSSAGIGGDDSKTGWGRVGMETKSTGASEDGSNFCPRAPAIRETAVGPKLKISIS